jgi:hypothetical protein
MKTQVKVVLLATVTLSVLLTALALTGCSSEKKVTPLPVGPMDEYRDPGYGFTVKFPKGWIPDTQVGRARFYSVQGADNKFRDPTGEYADGAMISVDLIKAENPAEEQKKRTDEMAKIGFQIGKADPVTIGGKQATKLPYKAKYSSTSLETGEHYYVVVDTLLYDIQLAGFSTLFDVNRAIFDAVVTSFQFAKPVEKGRDQTLPSEAMSDYSSAFFTCQYPDNYNFETVNKGNNDLAVSLRGANKYCAIQFTVFGAKGLTLEKVFEQNKGKFGGATAGKTTIGGQPAMTLTYSATKDVDRRFYFAVKNDKVIRITMDWYKPQRTEYLAAYDKVLNSMKFK